jgi:hypothetical protein
MKNKKIILASTLSLCVIALYGFKDPFTGKEVPTDIGGKEYCPRNIEDILKQSGQKDLIQNKKTFEEFVDIGFTKTPLASTARKKARLKNLNAIALNLLIRANDTARELLGQEYLPTWENVDSKLGEIIPAEAQEDTTQTTNASEFPLAMFERKKACNNQLMEKLVEKGNITSSHLKSFLAEEFNVLNNYYSRLRASIKTLNRQLGEKDVLPEEISLASLQKLGR